MSKSWSLVSPRLDFWLLGGTYLAVLLPLYWLYSTRAETPQFLQVAAMVRTLGHALNFSHFLVTYQLLYSDHRSKLLTRPSFGLAGIVAPIGIIAIIAAAFVSRSASLFDALSIAMMVSSTLHFLNQTFGGVIISSIHERVGFGRAQRFALKLNLMCIFGASPFMIARRPAGAAASSGLSLLLPPWAPAIALLLVASSTAYLAATLMRSRENGGLTRAPGARGGACYAGGWAWLLTVPSNPVFLDLSSFFHGLQYFAFVAGFRKGKVSAESGSTPRTQAERRRFWRRTIGYLLLPFPLAAVILGWAPGTLDALFGARFAELGPLPFTVAFHLFFNFHHYAIDSAIWRASDPEVQRYLFKSPRLGAAVSEQAGAA